MSEETGLAKRHRWRGGDNGRFAAGEETPGILEPGGGRTWVHVGREGQGARGRLQLQEFVELHGRGFWWQTREREQLSPGDAGDPPPVLVHRKHIKLGRRKILLVDSYTRSPPQDGAPSAFGKAPPRT